MNSRVRDLLGELRDRACLAGSDDYVFCKADGSRGKSIGNFSDLACRRARLHGPRFQDLRHTAASSIIMAGGSLLDAGQHLATSGPR